MSELFEFIGYVPRRTLLQLAVIALGDAIFELLNILFLRIFLLTLVATGTHAAPPKFTAWLGSGRPLDLAIATGSALLVFLVVKNAVLALGQRRSFDLLATAQTKLAVRLFERYLHMPFANILHRNRTELQQNLNVVAGRLFSQAAAPGLQIFSESLIVIGILLLLCVLAFRTTVLFLIPVGGAVAVYHALTANRTRGRGERSRVNLSRMMRFAQESLSDLKVVKLFARESLYLKIFERESSSYAKTLANERFHLQASSYVLEPVLIGAVVLLLLVMLVTEPGTANPYAQLALFAVAAMRLVRSINRILAPLATLNFHHANLRAALTDLRLPVESLPPRPRLPKPPFEHELRLDVSASYGTVPVLRQAQLQIRKGERVLLVGSSGAGKSTLLNVLLGVLTPTYGFVAADGIKIDPLPHMRTTSTAYVPQEIALIDGSMAENICFSEEEPDLERLAWAVSMVSLDQRIAILEGGLDARIGDNGIRLSGGERQRLGLARALYGKPAFLVLDEAMSQLDLRTEGDILARLRHELPELTVLSVAHKRADAAYFDRVLRLSAGKIVEEAGAAAADVAGTA